MKRIVLLILIIFFTACASNENKKSVSKKIIPDDVSYVVTEKNPDIAFNKTRIIIELNKKVDLDIIKEIAIQERVANAAFERIYIQFIVKGNNDGVWAIASFTPEYESEICGISKQNEITMIESTKIEGELIGKWIEDDVTTGLIFVIYKNESGNLKIKVIAKNNTMDYDCIVVTKNGKKRYKQSNNKHGEYYIIESDGSLGLYGENGRFAIAIPLSN